MHGYQCTSLLRERTPGSGMLEGAAGALGTTGGGLAAAGFAVRAVTCCSTCGFETVRGPLLL